MKPIQKNTDFLAKPVVTNAAGQAAADGQYDSCLGTCPSSPASPTPPKTGETTPGSTSRATAGMEEAINDLIKTYQAALMVSDGRTSPIEGIVSTSKPGSAHLVADKELSICQEIERTTRRVADVYRTRLVGNRGQPIHPSDKMSPARQEQTRAILREEGMDATAVAFIHGSTTDGVRKARGKAGLDRDTGLAPESLGPLEEKLREMRTTEAELELCVQLPPDP